jgi:hypothetical protein
MAMASSSIEPNTKHVQLGQCGGPDDNMPQLSSMHQMELPMERLVDKENPSRAKPRDREIHGKIWSVHCATRTRNSIPSRRSNP